MASSRTDEPAAQLIEIAWSWSCPSSERGLAPTERERYHRLRRQVDRDMFATGRALLRHVVAARIGVEPCEVVVRATCERCGSANHGAPTIDPVDRIRTAPHVSLAHAAGLVMVAATDVGPVGIDCEPLTGALAPGFVDVVLAPHEPVGPTGASAGALLRTWVRKESLLKATGHGLRVDPRAVVLSPWWEAPQVVALPGSIPTAGWRLQDVDPAPGFVGAVAWTSPRSGAPELTVTEVDLGRSDVRAAPATPGA